jgi:hypothetical protein
MKMSKLDVYGYTILGIRVKYNDFFATTNTYTTCNNNHIGDKEARYCAKCGKSTIRQQVREPRENLIEYAKKYYPDVKKENDEIDIMKVWQTLRYGKESPCIVNINAIQVEDEKMPSIAIGSRIGETKSHRTGIKPAAVPLSIVEEEKQKILKLAEQLGIKENYFELFTCSSITY